MSNLPGNEASTKPEDKRTPALMAVSLGIFLALFFMLMMVAINLLFTWKYNALAAPVFALDAVDECTRAKLIVDYKPDHVITNGELAETAKSCLAPTAEAQGKALGR